MIKELHQPYADPVSFTELLMKRIDELEVKGATQEVQNGSRSYLPTKLEVKSKLKQNILRANDFEARIFNEPVDTIIFEGVEYNRPIKLGLLPLPDELFRDYQSEVDKVKHRYAYLCKKISFQLKKLKNRKIKKPLSDETRRRMSEARKGKVPWNKGIPRTEEEKKKMSLSKKGKKRSEEAIRKSIEAKTGQKRSEEFKQKMREIATGRKHTAETKAKLSKIALQLKTEGKFTRKGIPLSIEHKRKLIEARAKAREKKSLE